MIPEESKPLSYLSVLIVDDHPISSEGLADYLKTDERIRVVGICSHAERVEQVVDETAPDLIIVDLVLDGSQMDGIDVIRRLRAARPAIKLLAVSAFSDQNHVLGAIAAGVDGYLLKTSSRVEVKEAIHTVASGKVIFDPKVQEILQQHVRRPSGQELKAAANLDEHVAQELTEREWEVLALLAEEITNREIAKRLYIAPKTVKTHVTNILSKLNANNRSQAAVWYRLNHHRRPE